MNTLDPAVLNACASAHGLAPAELTFVSASQNHIYLVDHKGVNSILRITHDRCHTLSSIEGELGWITHLEDHGIEVCGPLPSPLGRYVEEVATGGQPCFVAHFTHAPGRPVTERDLGPALFQHQGRLLARLHGAPAFHAHSDTSDRRHWFESRLLNEDMERFLPSGREPFKATVRQLIAELREIPEISRNFGLIHGDVYFQNYHLDDDGQRLWLFDFDNCEHGYFLQDLATCLYDCTFNKLTRE